MDMQVAQIMWANVGDEGATGAVSGDALTRAHHGITGVAVTAAPSVWVKVAAHDEAEPEPWDEWEADFIRRYPGVL